MATKWRAPTLLGAFLLCGCGGGGGGGGGPAPQPTTPAPSPAAPSGPLALTDTNAPDATSLVMREIEHAHMASESMLFTLDMLNYYRMTSATVPCGGSVNARLSNNDRDGSGGVSAGDVLRFEVSACSGVTRDVSMIITAIDYAARTLEGGVSFVESTAAGVRSTGTFSLSTVFKPLVLELTQTLRNIEVTIEGGGATATVSGGESVRYIERNRYRISASGRANSPALGGEFSFATRAPFTGTFGEVPTSGELELTGGTSRARIQPATDAAFRDDHFAHQVDANGSGVYSPARSVPWTRAVAGLIFCWEGNTNPEITSLSLAPADPTIRDQITASYTASDPDGDQVLYFPEWLVNGSVVSTGEPTLRLDRFKKGDNVTFVLRVRDPRSSSVSATTSLTIANSPPHNVTVTLDPTVARTTDNLVALYGSADVDQRDFPRTTFEWRRNGVVIPGQTGQMLPHTEQAKGQVITAIVHISDGEATVSASASITIQDSLPVVEVPTQYPNVAYGQTLSFDATASDADGDSIGQFVLTHGPAGMAVNPATGRITWPVRGPAFETGVEMNYGVTLDRPGANLARGSVSLHAPNREKPLHRTGLEAPLPSALIAGDFDNDGDEELLVAGENTLYELEWTGDRLRQSWVFSGPLNFVQEPGALATADIDGDGRHEIFIAHGSQITQLDGVERRPTVTIGPSRPDYVVRDLDIVDVDVDGRLDLVAIATLNGARDPAAAAQVMFFWGTTSFYDYPITEGSAIAVGNVDNDAQIEIVTNSGYVFDIFNWLAHWRYSTPFGWDIDVGDLDGDGIDEIVGSVDDGAVRAYSGVTRAATWTVANANTDAVLIADVAGDADEEVLIGDGEGGSGFVKVYSQTAPGTAALVAGINAVGYDVPVIATGDVDNDGGTDLIWGSTKPGPTITVAGGAPLDIQWTTADLAHGALLGPYVGGELARRPAGAPTVLFATTRSANGGALLVGMDPTSGDLTMSPDLGAPGNGNVALTVADYDNDGTHEALLASSSGATAYHRAYNFFGPSTEWNTTFASTQNGVAIARGDLTGDGRADIAAIDAQGVVRAYEIGSGAPFWTSPTLTSGRDVAIAELNGAGRPEIVVAAADRVRVYSRDGAPSYVQTHLNATALPELRDIEVGDIDGDGTIEIFALYGLENTAIPTQVKRLDAALTVRGGFDFWAWCRGLTIEQSSYARKNLLCIARNDSEGDRLGVIDPDSGEGIWGSPPLLGSIARDGVHFVDVAGNGVLSISVATSTGMYLTR